MYLIKCYNIYYIIYIYHKLDLLAMLINVRNRKESAVEGVEVYYVRHLLPSVNYVKR
jgi:hypothetical protein